MTEPLAALVVLPLAWASLAFVLGAGRGAWPAIAGLALQLWLALRLAGAVSIGATVTHAVGGWGAPLGIDLAADGLSATMLLLTQCVALPVAIYARAYFTPADPAGARFWPLAGFLVAGLNALFLSADLFNVYVTLEVVGLASVGLVAAGGGDRQVAAALRYLFATLLGSGAYLLGVAAIYGTYGTVSVAVLSPLLSGEAPLLAWIAAGLMLVGLMLKTALFPFSYWLPPAHGGASAPVSALLSALVVKGSFYVILRLWIGPFAPLARDAEFAGWLAALLGTMAIVWGSYRALRAERIKMLVAYSTVAQLGYLFLIFPLLRSPAAIEAGLMQAFAHGLAKAAMFAAAGVLIRATGQDRIAGLAGTAGRLQLTLFAFGLAGITLAGLPPSSGFLAKWALIDVALELRHGLVAVVALAGGLLSAAYVFRLLRPAFRATAVQGTLAPVPRTLEWTAFGLALASVLLGLRGVELVELVGRVEP